jgi:hypothetical protein
MDGAFFHTKCACHILNLIMKTGMEVDPIQNLIGTTRLRHGTPDTTCLIRTVPPFIIFGHDTARHKKKIRYGTARKHGVPEHDTVRHGTNLEHCARLSRLHHILFFLYFFFMKGLRHPPPHSH